MTRLHIYSARLSHLWIAGLNYFCHDLFACVSIPVRLHQQEGEDAVQFANRVKAAIARQGGLVDLLW